MLKGKYELFIMWRSDYYTQFLISACPDKTGHCRADCACSRCGMELNVFGVLIFFFSPSEEAGQISTETASKFNQLTKSWFQSHSLHNHENVVMKVRK